MVQGIEYQGTQFAVEVVKCQDRRESASASKTMNAAVLFHHTPITGKTEIADVVEDGYSLFLIFKNKPSLLQYVYLFSEGDGLLCIFHIKRNVPPWSAGLATRSVVGFVDAKVVLLFETAKLFEEKE